MLETRLFPYVVESDYYLPKNCTSKIRIHLSVFNAETFCGSKASLFYTKTALTQKFQLLLEHASTLRLKLLSKDILLISIQINFQIRNIIYVLIKINKV